jgi:mannonate dehydratase
MRIVEARVNVCCPGRNFVTLKLITEDGTYGLGDATLHGRELAVASYLRDHVAPLLIGRDARRMNTWRPLQGRVLARSGDDDRDLGCRHGVVGPVRQKARRAGV